MNEALTEVLAEAPPYDDRGAGARNAAALESARVRPAFFDMSCLIYRAIYAKADSYVRKCGDDGRIAHAIAADVLTDVADACRHFACGPVAAFDSGTSFRERQVFSGYKDRAVRGQQKKTPAQERVLASCKGEAVRLLRRVYCPAYRVQTFLVHGYESDDIIASFVLGLKQSGLMREAAYARPVVIVTSDHDLYQLLVDGVHLADVKTGVLCTGEDVERHTKIAVRDVVAAKCVGGCTSDTIPNVPGCGDKTVAEVLAKRNGDVKVAKARAALASPEGAAVLRRNLRLIRLPFVGSPAMPPLLLSAKVWPRQGVPEDMADLLDANGVPRESWPSFADVTLPRSATAVPVCAYKRKDA